MRCGCPGRSFVAYRKANGCRGFRSVACYAMVDAARRRCGGGGRGLCRIPAARHLRLESQHVDWRRPFGRDRSFNPKHILLEVFGPPGTVATINYLDVNAQPQRADHVTLPWAYDTTTTQPAVFVNVMAQGNSDSLGCRIIIDGVVKDERQVNTMNAYTYCLDKSG